LASENEEEYLSSCYPPVVPTLLISVFLSYYLACALYEEFWMNYISWLESLPEADTTHKIRSAFRRACTSHLPNKVSVPSSTVSGSGCASIFGCVPDPDLVAPE
jgi:hypothetical protein